MCNQDLGTSTNFIGEVSPNLFANLHFNSRVMFKLPNSYNIIVLNLNVIIIHHELDNFREFEVPLKEFN